MTALVIVGLPTLETKEVTGGVDGQTITQK